MTARIAIVGGGYVGATLARALDPHAAVTLVEPRTHFIHAPATIRAVVEPELLDRALIPLDRLLARGEVVRARAAAVDAGGVTLADGGRVAADWIVVATGSANGAPFKPEGDDLAAFRAASRRAHEQLRAAETVAIVGAGAVGVELAGEIAYAMPGKRVTLVSGTPRLFPDQPEALGDALAAKLRAMGVTLILGARAEGLQSTTEPHPGTLRLPDGTEHRFDLVFPALGSRPDTALLAGLPGARLAAAGRVAVDPWLRPSTLENVFAAGDAVDAGDGMTIVTTSRQVPWLRRTLRAVAKGRRVEALAPFRPWGPKAPILVPLGPQRGNSFLGLFTAGDFVTRKMKGADLFVPKYRKLLNQA
ncbi:NAD(P)/FAD-dependent oxidoreductase [Jannaschia sp. W003]|uniref:NAD(P)/FAD-dependent oxidoreductase n=1 Tax=Jannaschia sp. W003 TaxID=2867012 RepID=UPI0021A8D74C|nr:FAD-dependent oxidoreductase [Jannaschia sp. W003]UWQ22502.1 FAD-dependent oxidoreductase [Jannaschia sp. W003]